MRKNKYAPLCMAIMLLLPGTGCKKMLQLDPQANQVVFQTAFESDATAVATVNGLYAEMKTNPQYFSSFGLSLYPALMADELYNTRSSSAYDPFTAGKLNSGLAAVNGIWGAAYQYIYHINNCLEGIPTAPHLTDLVRKQLTGELKFMRAFCYFYLVNLFGDVPLVISTDYELNAKMPRIGKELVNQQIKEDLNEARSLLTVDYPMPGRSRPNQYTAIAMLARFYLYQDDWSKAEEFSSEVLSSGLYSLSPLNEVFMVGSNETIWQLNTAGLNYNTYEGNAFIPSSSRSAPFFAATDRLLDRFEPGDNRKTLWLSKQTVAGTVYFYPYKYKVRTGSTIAENPIYFRLAEQYLIRAEARAHLGKTDLAIEDLNVIRTRAGLTAFATVDKETLLLAINKERQVELFSEWGHRWFDLKRTGKLDQVLAPVKPDWQTHQELWPVPIGQILLNPALEQNPGY